MEEPFLKNLNQSQLRAVCATEGPVRVIAGAGTGKTRTLTSRFCRLVATLGIAPKNILCATFTNRAAGEMKNRVRAALGDMDLGYICTFHAFCVRLLKEDIHILNYPKNFIILDVEDQKQLLLKIFDDMGLTLRETTVKRTLDEVLEARKLRASTYIDDIYEFDNERLKAKFRHARNRDEEIFLRYLYEQKKNFGCDFNDLINFSVYLLEKFPDVRQKWQDRMQYVMVDEFQDVSGRQYKLARMLAGKHGNLFIVGDPDQTIYSWRGSHVGLFLDFDKLYPEATTVTLTTNYRSTPEILAAATALIEKNAARFRNALAAAKEHGKRAVYRHAKNDRDEAEWICGEIAKLRAAGAAFGDIAVLYRAHYLTRALEESFIRKGLPYKIFSGVEFYGRREIKDIICYLRMVTSGDDAAFLRTINTPPRSIGKKRLALLKEHAEGRSLSLYDSLKACLETDPFRSTEAERYVRAVEHVRERRPGMKAGDALQTLLDMSGYEEFLRLQGDQERLDNVAELKRAVENAGKDGELSLEDFLAGVALFAEADRGARREAVGLMTVHAAKGMEFPYVFICGLNEGVFPGRRISGPEEMEEERRLAYVAMTRAMDGLFLSDCEGVSDDGLFKHPSRFLFEAGEENLDFAAPLDGRLRQDAKGSGERARSPGGADGAAFLAGERIVHPVFGAGTIAAAHPGWYSIRFDALKTERSIQSGASLAREAADESDSHGRGFDSESE
jgi:DNA helicase-2/ATP-dependent DNA helicase PcrA